MRQARFLPENHSPLASDSRLLIEGLNKNINNHELAQTVAEVEKTLAGLGCTFPPPIRESATGEMVCIVRRWDESETPRVAMYKGAPSDRFLQRELSDICASLGFEPSIFSL